MIPFFIIPPLMIAKLDYLIAVNIGQRNCWWSMTNLQENVTFATIVGVRPSTTLKKCYHLNVNKLKSNCSNPTPLTS